MTQKLHLAIATALLALAPATPGLALELGVNLNSVSDYTPATPFNDLMKNARPWMTKSTTPGNYTFDTGQIAQLTRDPVTGWPAETIPFAGNDGQSHVIHTIWATSNTPTATGTYTLYYEGEGSITINCEGSNKPFPSSTQNSYTVGTFDRLTSTSSLTLTVTSSNPNNNGKHIKNIRLIQPNAFDPGTNNVTQTFSQPFRDMLKDYTGPLRFMDWGDTNWSQITTTGSSKDYFTQSVDTGVSVAYMVELANTANRDMWYCVPHRASDAYITATAQYIAANLNSNLKVWVEYSNETWNSLFADNPSKGLDGQYTEERALAQANYGGSANWPKAHAERSANAWSLFRAAFGSQPARVVRVLAGWNYGLTDHMTAVDALADPAINHGGQVADVHSASTYINHNLTAASDNFDNTTWKGGANSYNVNWSTAGWTLTPTTNVSLQLVSGSNRVAKLVNNASITRTINTSNALSTNASAGIIWKADGLGTGNTATFEVDRTGAGDWFTVATLDSTNNGVKKTVALVDIPGFVKSANTQVRVTLNGNAPANTLTVEEVNLFVLPTVDYLLDNTWVSAQTGLINRLKPWIDFAALHNAVFYAYEGGQHFLVGDASNKDYANNLLIAMNRSSKMKTRYLDWLKACHNIGVQGIVHYSDLTGYGVSGYWGTFEYYGQLSTETPKRNAIQEWRTTPQPATFTDEALDSYYNSSLVSEDKTPTAYQIQDSGATLFMGPGNVWKRLAYGYGTTAKTRLTFEYLPGTTREVHGVGLDNNVTQTELAFYKVAGTQGYGTAVSPISTTNGWQLYDIAVGQLSQPVYYLILANDHDVSTPDASSSYRNVRLYEAP